jgi:cytidyltransferase-like protein
MKTTVYLDGIFDLFHMGHLESIKQCRKLGNKVIIGVVSDKDAEKYKRMPVINQNQRADIIRNLRIVDEVIENAPMQLKLDFIEKYKIDLVVHAFADEKDYNKQKQFYKEIDEIGKFKRINYYSKESTSGIIRRILENYKE